MSNKKAELPYPDFFVVTLRAPCVLRLLFFLPS
jgi:hypothetical protein